MEDFAQDPGKQIVDSEVAEKYGDLPVVVKDYVVVGRNWSDNHSMDRFWAFTVR